MLRYIGCKAPVSFGIAVIFLFASADASAQAFPNGYSYARPIVIDHRRVANSDQTDFPVLVSGIFAYLATIANGGKVQNGNGYDIIFTSDAAGLTRLDHEIDNYDPLTGNASFWVRIPMLSHTSDTAIYLWYGNSAITASQENKPAVWGNGYASVYHFGTPSTLKLTDSGSANYTLSANAAAASGSIGGGASFSGGTSLTHSSVTSYPLGSSPVTLETWFKTSSSTSQELIGYGANSTTADRIGLYMDSVAIYLEGQNTSFWSNRTSSDGNWHHLVGVYAGGQLNPTTSKLYLDGAQLTDTTVGNAFTLNILSNELKLGGIPTVTFCCTYNGSLDEVRISSGTRSADWIATEYNNQSSAATFSIACAEASAGTQPTPCVLTAPPSSFNYKRPVIIDHTKIPNADQTDFPVLISGIFPYLATAANGGQVQSASGYDIVFTSDAAGQSQLDHEIDTYDPATGTASFWVRVPSLSHSNDTPIYMWYGSPVVASQENKAGVWRNGYTAVWHLGNGNLLDITDSTGKNFGSALNVSASQSAKIGGAASFSGANNSYFDIPGISAVKPTTALTLEAWINPSQMGTWNSIFSIDYRADGSWWSPWQAYQISSQNPASKLSFGLANVGGVSGTQTIPLSQWTHVVGTYDGSAVRLYENGVLDASASATGTIAYGSSKNLTIGNDSKYQTCCLTPWNGLMDELRISSVGRSTDWVATEYNNQNSPSTFAIIEPANYFGVLTSNLPAAGQYLSYSAGLSAIGGTAPFTWSVVSGSLPAGLSLASAGTISGTPTAAGTTTFTVQVTDANSNAATRNVSVTVNPPPPIVIANASLPGSTTNASYSATLSATGGISPYTWSITVGALPSGLSLNSTTGVISGTTPPTGGVFSFTVQALDSVGGTGTKNLGIGVFHADSLVPTTAPVGGLVTITGTGFGATQGTGGVTFNGVAAAVNSWSNTSVTVTVPAGLATGTASVTLSAYGVNGSALPINITPAPAIASLSPTQGANGTTVTITGTTFGASQGTSTVTFNGLSATVTSWSDTQIMAKVPVTWSGPVRVIVDGSASNGITFTVPAPQIASISPTSGVVGTQVTITGAYFGPAPVQNSGVNITCTAYVCGATINSWSDTQIVITVPGGSVNGRIWVVVNSVGSNQVSFTMPNPYISSVTPSSGPVLSQIQINGTDFLATQGDSTLKLGGVPLTVVSWSNTQIVATVPETANTGSISMVVGGVASSGNPTFSIPAPHIVSISPATAGVGNIITVTGTNFRPHAQQYSNVVFTTNWGAIEGQLVSWSDTQVSARTPFSGAGMTTITGPMNVVANGVWSNAVTFTVPNLVINSLSPNNGPVGSQVAINGANFGATQGTSTVSFNGSPAVSIVSWSDTQIVATVADTTTTGPALVTVNGINSNRTLNFTVPGPIVDSLSPAGGAVGAQFTINGGYFQNSQRDSTVTMNGTPVTIVSWSDAHIVAQVPSGATDGPVVVTVNSVGSNTNRPFDVVSPTITSLAPPAGAVGGTVTINGTGFGATQGSSAVRFNGVAASISSWSDTTINAVVPSGANSGPVTVTNFGATSNGVQFTLEGAPAVASIAPVAAYVGNEVTITGSGFGASQSNSTVTFANGAVGTASSWSDTRIVVPIPSGSIYGAVEVKVAGLGALSSQIDVVSVAQVTDSLGHVTNYLASVRGGKTRIYSSDGSGCSTCTLRGASFSTYDDAGHLLSFHDALDHVTNYTYDGQGNVASETRHIDANTTVQSTYTYNGLGEVLTATDPLTHVTTNTYDPKGNLLTVTTPAPNGSTPASVTTFTYDPNNGKLLTITDPLNHVTTLAYTPAGLIHTVTDANQKVTRYEYDARGNRIDVYDALNHHTHFDYDPLSNYLTKITYDDGTYVQFGYDNRGRRTSVTDQNLHTTAYAYDDADRLSSVTDAATNLTQYGYNTESGLTSITDAMNRITGFDYDEKGRVKKTTFPSTLFESYVYDDNDNLTSKTDRKNQTITYSYDWLNRLLHKGYPDSTGVDYTYDLASRITQVSDPTGVYGSTYDNMGRLKTTTTQYSFIPGQTYSNTYTYDAASNRTGFTAPDSSTTTYGYDVLNRLTDQTNSWAGHFVFGYDDISRRTSLTRPNGVNTSYGYDNLSRLLSVLHQQGANTVDGAIYTYDNAGNRLTKQNLLNGVADNYIYDAIYQLKQVTQGATTTESYTYDAVGNRLSSLNVATYSYDSSNHLNSSSDGVSYTYDNNGNTLTKTDVNGTTQFAWDFENRLRSVTLPGSGGVVTFNYDPFGRRIQKSSSAGTTNYVYDGANIVTELNSAGGSTAKYAQGAGIDEPLAMSRAGVTIFYDADGLGSITSLYDSTGMQTASYGFTTFGNTTSVGALLNPFQYTGRERDSETGLYFYRARYYDLGSTRFISEDPIRFKGGNNFYSYVTNNPASLIDPLGLCIVEVFFNPVERLGITWGFHAYIVVTDNVSKSRHPVTEWSGGLNEETGALWMIPQSQKFADNPSDAVAYMSIVNDQCSCRSINAQITSVQEQINDAAFPYDKFSTNSNAAITTVLQELHLPYGKAPVFAPGWGLNVLKPNSGYTFSDSKH